MNMPPAGAAEEVDVHISGPEEPCRALLGQLAEVAEVREVRDLHRSGGGVCLHARVAPQHPPAASS
jgi:hypothetical protein